MADQEWYRRATWTEEDQEQFFARLKRSRGAFQKAQYCRIQALHLYETDQPELVTAALDLLEKIQSEWPEEEVAPTWAQKGECYELLSQAEMAIAAYQEVFKAQRTNSGHITSAHINFSWLVATNKVTRLYDEALAVLSEFAGSVEFANDKYKANTARALIYRNRGDQEKARRYAKFALEGAAQSSSGIAYHQHVGLVKNPDTESINLLRSLVET